MDPRSVTGQMANAAGLENDTNREEEADLIASTLWAYVQA